MASGKYTGLYRGLVITDVPDNINHMFQVQVYVCDVDSPIDIFDKNVGYIFPGKGTMSTDVITALRATCPWYSVVSPVSGGGSMGRLIETNTENELKYNGYTTVSDLPVSEEIADSSSKTFGYAVEGKQGVTTAPHYQHGPVTLKTKTGGFADPTQNWVQKANIYDASYTKNVDYYVNAPKGSYNIPKLGAFVIVGYLDGLKEHGYIIGKAPSTREWQLVHSL